MKKKQKQREMSGVSSEWMSVCVESSLAIRIRNQGEGERGRKECQVSKEVEKEEEAGKIQYYVLAKTLNVFLKKKNIFNDQSIACTTT